MTVKLAKQILLLVPPVLKEKSFKELNVNLTATQDTPLLLLATTSANSVLTVQNAKIQFRIALSAQLKNTYTKIHVLMNVQTGLILVEISVLTAKALV